MVDRITSTNVKKLFKEFAEKKHIKTSAKWYKNKHRYSNKFLKLDYNPYYGGWRMDWVNPNTSESFYSNYTRRSTREMYNYLQGLVNR
jgi:hypothetical protein